MTTAVFPGSFGPFHLGHRDVVRSYLDTGNAEKIIVLVRGGNKEKIRLIDLDNAAELACRSLPNEIQDTVKVIASHTFICPAKETGADVVLRGIRFIDGQPSKVDIEHEQKRLVERLNHPDSNMRTEVPTIFIEAMQSPVAISSTAFRNAFFLGDGVDALTQFVDEGTATFFIEAARGLSLPALQALDRLAISEFNQNLKSLLGPSRDRQKILGQRPSAEGAAHG